MCLLAALTIAATMAARPQAVVSDREKQARSDSGGVIYLFWTITCPHCAKAKSFLDGIARRETAVTVRAFELSESAQKGQAFEAIVRHFKIEPPAVPVIVIGDKVFVGYEEDATTGAEIEAEIAACRRHGCVDVAAAVIERAGLVLDPAREGLGQDARAIRRPPLPETIRVPLIGEVAVRSLSLPVLTVLLGAIDGFNPCAMWVLVFLIGLLLGIPDRFRMWSYGAAFLLTSGIVYFAFMAAWLNIFLFLGSLAWIRGAIGVFALVAGGYYLREFIRNPEAACPVAAPGERRRIMDRLKEAVSERSYLLAMASIVLLAFSVNLIELLCSAGIPAVYTQVLALSDLSRAAYYGYLALYLAVFLLDDVIVFVTAMLTLQASGLAASYSRYSHLIGGVVLGGMGLLLLLRPEWLSIG